MTVVAIYCVPPSTVLSDTILESLISIVFCTPYLLEVLAASAPLRHYGLGVDLREK